MVNIKGLKKSEVLIALYNNSKIQGLGSLQAINRDLTIDEATALLKKDTYFDYLYGKVMKIDLSSDIEFDEWGYDRDNGQGSAKQVIEKLRR